MREPPLLRTSRIAMEKRERKLTVSSGPIKEDKFDLDKLLHPASAFAHPIDVVHDADLTLNEKRAILASARQRFGSRGSLGRHHGCAPRP